ncbi:STAS domain-containing protein [Krasilnikovia sp. MM14-A1259]|uniref:STAS domain-containing protein n=1 Tax=Krasilnikovia sp. MM14-A1259 TaxID=3373539 RepID=UPI0037F63DA2
MDIADAPDVRSLLRVDVQRHPDATTVVLAGEIDMVTCAQVSQVVTELLHDDQRVPVVLDMADVTFLDSSGIRALLICHKDAKRFGRQIDIRPVHDRVRQVLQVCGLEELLLQPAS